MILWIGCVANRNDTYINNASNTLIITDLVIIQHFIIAESKLLCQQSCTHEEDGKKNKSK